MAGRGAGVSLAVRAGFGVSAGIEASILAAIRGRKGSRGAGHPQDRGRFRERSRQGRFGQKEDGWKRRVPLPAATSEKGLSI